MGGVLKQGDFLIFFLEVVDGPFVREEDDPCPGGILGQSHIAAHVAAGEGIRVRIDRQPAHLGERGVLEADIGGVFSLEAVFDDFELELPNSTQQCGFLLGVVHIENLNDALVEELFEPFLELLVARGGGVVQVGKDFRREAGNFVVDQIGDIGQRVTDAEIAMADESDNIAGICAFDGFAILPEEFLRIGQAQGTSAAWIGNGHVLLENSGTDADKGEAVAVIGVHIGLDFENECGELRMVGRH